MVDLKVIKAWNIVFYTLKGIGSKPGPIYLAKPSTIITQ